MSRFVRPEEQLGLHKGSVYSTTHSENPAKSAVAKPVSLLSPLIAITVHSYIFDIENLLFFC